MLTIDYIKGFRINRHFFSKMKESIVFPDDNKIRFTQDFRFWGGMFSDVNFYPIKESESFITFIADGYGILKDNKFGLSGKYGNGSIFVFKEYLPSEIVEWAQERIKLLNAE